MDNDWLPMTLVGTIIAMIFCSYKIIMMVQDDSDHSLSALVEYMVLGSYPQDYQMGIALLLHSASKVLWA